MLIIGRVILFMTGFTVPVEYVAYFEVLGIPITPSKLATGLLVIYAALLWASGARRQQPPGTPAKHLLILAFGGSACVGFIVSLFSGLPVGNLVTMLSTWLLLVVFYFTLGRSLLNRRDVEWFLAAVGLGAVFVSITGLLGLGFQTSSMQGDRIGGLGGNSNELALNILLGLAIAGYFVSTVRGGFARLFWIAGVPIMVAGLIGTLSRSGMLALVVMGVMWMTRFRRFDTLKYSLPAIVVAIGIALVAPPQLTERLETLDPDKIGTDTSVESRLNYLPYAIGAFASNPVWGTGMFGSQVYAQRESKGRVGSNTIHNIFLQVAADFGLLGLIPMLAIVWISWSDLSRCWATSRRRLLRADAEFHRLGLMAVFLQIGFLGVLLIGQVQPTHNSRGLWLVYAISPVLVGLMKQRLSTQAVDLPERADPHAPPLAPPTPGLALARNR